MWLLLPQPIAGEPFPGSKTGEPRHVELMRAAFKLKDPPEAMWALTRRELVSSLSLFRSLSTCLYWSSA
jgi:hypothetical protein